MEMKPLMPVKGHYYSNSNERTFFKDGGGVELQRRVRYQTSIELNVYMVPSQLLMLLEQALHEFKASGAEFDCYGTSVDTNGTSTLHIRGFVWSPV